MFIPQLYHASLWAVFCVTPVLHAGCGVLVDCLMCSHGRVQSGCCADVVALSLPVTGVEHLRVTVLVRCVLCTHGEAAPVNVWNVGWWGWYASFSVARVLVAAVHGWFVVAFAIKLSNLKHCSWIKHVGQLLRLLFVLSFMSFVAMPGLFCFLHVKSHMPDTISSPSPGWSLGSCSTAFVQGTLANTCERRAAGDGQGGQG